MSERPWFFGLMREAGGYRIIASGPSEKEVRRTLGERSTPTLIVTREDLSALGIGETEWRRWLPETKAGAAS